MNEPTAQLQTVNVYRENGAATVELNRPDALNAWNAQLGADLLAALGELAQDGNVRAVTITGAGRAFSSGADLKDMSGGELTPDGRPDVYKTLTERYHPIMHAIREMGKPVLASVNGPAVNRVFPEAELAAETAALAARLAAGPTSSYAGSKRQLNNWLYSRIDEQLELEAQIQQEMAGSDDFVEGATAFIQKRAARFQGR